MGNPIDTCILVIGPVNDAPNQIRYQRVKSLSKRYRLHVISTAPLPASLGGVVTEVHVVARGGTMWWEAVQLAGRLRARSGVVVHTVYAPRTMIAGFLCHVLLGCRWVYDLYDHPSMTWSFSRGVKRFVKWATWRGVLSRMLPMADVWIIGMHPGILSHLPVPRQRCRLVLADGPGTSVTRSSTSGRDEMSMSEVAICYAGRVRLERGIGLVAEWCRIYKGPPACLYIMGAEEADAVAAIESAREEAGNRGLRIVRQGWMAHEKVLETMMNADIGICLIDPSVLNYRYAYPVKVVEYMSVGLIPVATDGEGVRSLIRDGENGFVSKYELAAFSRTMERALCAVQNSEEKAKILRNAARSVESRDWDTINGRLLADLEIALSVSE